MHAALDFQSDVGKSRKTPRSHESAPFSWMRAELKVTHLRWRSPICGFLRLSANSCGFLRKSAGFLRFPAPSKCWNFQEKGWICENLQFSAKPCFLGSLCHLSSVPLSVPWWITSRIGHFWFVLPGRAPRSFRWAFCPSNFKTYQNAYNPFLVGHFGSQDVKKGEKDKEAEEDKHEKHPPFRRVSFGGTFLP